MTLITGTISCYIINDIYYNIYYECFWNWELSKRCNKFAIHAKGISVQYFNKKFKQ